MNRTVMTMWCGANIGALIAILLMLTLPTGLVMTMSFASIAIIYAVYRLVPGAMEP